LTGFSASGVVNSVIASLPQNFDATTRWVEASALVVVTPLSTPLVAVSEECQTRRTF
jgi:hypothetical protein